MNTNSKLIILHFKCVYMYTNLHYNIKYMLTIVKN